uniref:Lymphoid-specific helicase n=2 Tax=Lygus hesperus TaxID=30085 RepID=A0A0A9XJ64_LYGHE
MARNLLKTSKLLGKTVLPVILTSYEVPIYDEKILSKPTWKYLVVDEGHKIKNHKTKLARVLGGFKSVNRLLLTGTPLQNNLAELWSLLHFLLPEVFDSLDVFETLFTAEELEREEETEQCLEKEKKSNILTLLQEVLTPFLLRRLKTDVDLAIPNKKEILVHCPMTKIQLELYKAVLDKSILVHSKFYKDTEIIPDNPDGTKLKRYSKLRDPSICHVVEDREWDVVKFGEGDNAYKLHVKMTAPHIVLIKILNHPYLIHPKVFHGSNILQVDDEITQSSGKMTILDGLLKRLKARGHRVLIFSTYTAMLDIIEEYMGMCDYEYRRLDGNTDIEDRRTYMREFNTDPDIFAFLLSTRAGGLGINLTGADTVIIYNSDWNPQADLQAQDRCHRIGQKNLSWFTGSWSPPLLTSA